MFYITLPLYASVNNCSVTILACFGICYVNAVFALRSLRSATEVVQAYFQCGRVRVLPQPHMSTQYS